MAEEIPILNHLLFVLSSLTILLSPSSLSCIHVARHPIIVLDCLEKSDCHLHTQREKEREREVSLCERVWRCCRKS
ncbi:hypothetical protein EUGRSUZ_F00377 [Eucalyptus grandis]|uniref:Uncharacterized protein n=2 Tax=Eucalyptus grandis TaxID=71139 RepID=A0ACC3KCS0_EUCGR|nr:hypothetical protein EUGRSUZ_F00377 [Eucalyptus grandis]